MSEDKANTTARATESMREKLTLAVVGFVLTGILGGVLTAWIQQRGWAWQNRVATIEKDVDNAVSTYKATSELLNLQWHAAYRVVRGLEREQAGDVWASIRSEFEAADREWALHYPNVARDVEFYIDGPFGVDGSTDLNKVWTYVCEGGTTRAIVETKSARVLLELINHCQDQLKSSLQALVDPPASGARLDATQRKASVDLAYRKLDQLYRTNDSLRCVMFDRAISIRDALSSQSYWSASLGIERPVYRISRKIDECA